jgi:DNA modification methylase
VSTDNVSASILKGKNDAGYWEMDSLAKLVTPIQNKHIPVYKWYNFKHSFSRNLVLSILSSLNLKEGDIVFDPFCGAGTTLLASREMGLKAIGSDLMPLSIIVSNAKLGKYSKSEISRRLREITSLPSKNKSVADSVIHPLKKYFPPTEFADFLLLRDNVMDIENVKTRNLFLMALLSALEDASFTKKDGAFLREVNNKVTKPVRKAFSERMEIILQDLPFLNNLPTVDSYAILSDARRTGLKTDSVATIITSPPYPNRHDYTRIYYLELMLGFFQDYSDIKELRYKMFRSHVEARKVYEPTGYEQPAALTQILEKINGRDLPNRKVVETIQGYFEDMYIFLRETYRVLRHDGTMHIIIGDARYGGIAVPAGKLTARIGTNVGFTVERIQKARDRGNSPQQMGKFGKVSSPENIISFRKI